MKQGVWQEIKWKSNTYNSKFKTFKPFSHLPDLYGVLFLNLLSDLVISWFLE